MTTTARNGLGSTLSFFQDDLLLLPVDVNEFELPVLHCRLAILQTGLAGLARFVGPYLNCASSKMSLFGIETYRLV